MVVYEWIVEALDEYGDIDDVFHAADFMDAIGWAAASPQKRICLVRDSGPRLETKLWAYLENGTLPATFSDSAGDDSGVKVPNRFKVESIAFAG